MGVRVASWNLLLHLLILLIAKHVESRKLVEAEENPIPNNILKLPSSKIEISHTHHLHMDETKVKIFFTPKDLKKGVTMPIYFPKKEISSSPHFLPRDEADSIPFSYKDLPNLLSSFSFAPESPQGTAMAETLRSCETRPIKGETKTCATSLESMLDFTTAALASHHIGVLTTKYLTKSSTTFQNYTVLETPEEVAAPKMVACHTMPYPYAVFYCHYQESENKVYKIRLRGHNGDDVDAVAVCHMDTSRWSPNHVSFQVLGVGPGTDSPVCHFFPADNLVWLAKPRVTSY